MPCVRGNGYFIYTFRHFTSVDNDFTQLPTHNTRAYIYIYSRRARRFTLFFTLRDTEQKIPLSYFNNILIPRSLLQKSSRTADNDNAWSSDGRERSQQRAAIHLIMPHFSAGKQQRKHEEAVRQGKTSLCRRHSHHEFHNFTAQIFT